MRVLLDQIEQSLQSSHYYLSLISTLTVPDIAGALDSEDGRANGNRYARWYDAWVRPRFQEQVRATVPPEAAPYVDDLENPLDGDACYRFRCSLLHQGSSQHPASPFTRIIFIEPGATTNVVHYSTLNDALAIDLPRFCREILAGARLWLDDVEGTEPFETNLTRFATRHESGLEPYITGVPVIG